MFPGIGISGIVGILALGAGVFWAFKVDTYVGVSVMAGSLVITSIFVWLSIKYDVFSAMFLSKEITSTIDKNGSDQLQIGEKGVTTSRLAPMGKARFAEKYVEVTSWDGFVDSNVTVEIIQINDNTIYVSPIKTS